MDIRQLGWTEARQVDLASIDIPDTIPGRVARQDRGRYTIMCEFGNLAGELSGRFRHRANDGGDYPAVGDWVAHRPAPSTSAGPESTTIHALLPRNGCFSRKVAGQETVQQVVAANVDTVFLVSGLDYDFNIRRIERYVTSAWESGARPVVVLNKADLCDQDELAERREQVASVAFGLPIHAVSAISGLGVEILKCYVESGQTAALLGSSGVGKSSIINALLGEQRLDTREVSEHLDRGRHTTTHRELILIPDGGVIVDTPGMRELQLWSDGSDAPQGFDDIEQLAQSCRFGDCSHESEPGCAVQAALEAGDLDPGRFESYKKLQRELARLARRADKRLDRQERRAWGKKMSQFHKEMKRIKKNR